MKREILFRVWDIVEKCYLPEDVYCILNRTEFGAFGQMIKDWRDYKEGEWFYDDSQILEQFTGLADKNGVKIFEADVLSSKSPYRYYVKYKDTAFYVYHCEIKDLDKTPYRWGLLSRFNELGIEIEVIGNIHDNPELLK